MLVRFCMNRVGVLVGREESFACCIRAILLEHLGISHTIGL